MECSYLPPGLSMSCWNSPRSASSYVSKLDLTLCRPKCSRSCSHASQPACGDHCFRTQSDLSPVSCVSPLPKEKFANGCSGKPGEASALHCSRLDVTLEQPDRRKSPVKSSMCTCSCTATRPHMPWRYSSSCSSSHGSHVCFGQGGFAHDHGCGFTNSKSTVTIQRTSPSSKDQGNFAEPFPSVSKSNSSWTSRLDVVLANNSAVSATQIGKPYTIFTSCNSNQPSKDYAENVTPMSNIKGVKMYISSCSLTVQPLHSKCQGGSLGHPVLLMPQRDNSPKQYSVGLQTPPKGFMVSEAPTLQITQFQLTRTPSNTPPVQQTSTSDIWMSPERLQKGTSGSPDMVPNVLVFQRGCSPGCKTNLYPVLLPSQHKASKLTLMIGSPVAPVPVQIIQEYSRSPTPAIFISNCDKTSSPEDLGSGYLLSVNPIPCPKPKHVETPRSSSLYGNPSAKCKPTEQYLCQTPPCTMMPRIQNNRDTSVPINVSIETFGNRRGAVKISISLSREPSNFGTRF